MSNPRIKKKLCKASAEYFPNVAWCTNLDNPVCDFYGELPKGTPVFIFEGNGVTETISPWAMLQKTFLAHQQNHISDPKWRIRWLFGRKATPANVFHFAYWDDYKFEHYTGLEFFQQNFIDMDNEENEHHTDDY